MLRKDAAAAAAEHDNDGDKDAQEQQLRLPVPPIRRVLLAPKKSILKNKTLDATPANEMRWD